MIAQAGRIQSLVGRAGGSGAPLAPPNDPPPPGYSATRSGVLAPAEALASLPHDSGGFGGGRHYRVLRNDPARRRHVRDRVSSADAIGQLSNAELRALSRSLARNEPAYVSALDNFVTTAISGPFGPAPRPLKKYLGGASKAEIDAFVQGAKKTWRRWSRRPFIGIELNWSRGIELIGRSVLEGFDVFAIAQRRPEGAVGRMRGVSMGFAWRLLDPEQIAEEHPNPVGVRDGNPVAGGVERGADGEPVALHIYERHPGDLTPTGSGRFRRGASPYRTRRVPWYDAHGRENVIAIFRPTRAGQSRGVSPLAAGMQLASDMGELREAALVMLKVATLFSVFRTYGRNNPAAPGRSGVVQSEGEPYERTDGTTQRTTTLQAGTIFHLDEGEEIKTANPPQVSPVVREMTETSLVQLGALTGTSYEVLTRDFRNTNYSSARAAFALTWRSFSAFHEMLNDTIVRASYERVIEEGVARGTIPLPGYDPEKHVAGEDPFRGEFEEWSAYKLITPGLPHIDKLKELQGDQMAVEMGVSTRADVAAARGDDYDDLPERRQAEEEELRELGLPNRLSGQRFSMPDAEDGAPAKPAAPKPKEDARA